MTAFKTLGLLIASLALIGVADAQKGGGKPGGGGGGTPTPYSPVIVNVVCDGSGTKLQDALNALNPVANVYEVRVSGVCPERVSIRNFSALSLKSENPNSFATIGSVFLEDNGKIELTSLSISASARSDNPLQGDFAVYAFDSGNLYALSDLRFSCDFVDGCRFPLYFIRAKARITEVNYSGYSDPILIKSAQGSYITLTASFPSCLLNGAVQAETAGYARVLQPDGCPQQKLTALAGGTITYAGPNATAVYVDNGTIYGVSSSQIGNDDPFFDGLTCKGASVVASYTFGTPGFNHCTQ